MEFSVDFLNAIAKKGWKFAIIIFPIYIIVLIILISLIIFGYFINPDLPKLIDKYHLNSGEIITLLLSQVFTTLLILFMLFLLKGDKKSKIRKLRFDFYEYSYSRTSEVFKYRYETPKKHLDSLSTLLKYNGKYKKDQVEHRISYNNLSKQNIYSIDSMIIIYTINENENVIFSIWHSGNKLCIAIASPKDALQKHEKSENILEEIQKKYESVLNITGSITTISYRDKFLWFDIIYDKISNDFLINNIEQEIYSRQIAHIVSVGLLVTFEILGWKRN